MAGAEGSFPFVAQVTATRRQTAMSNSREGFRYSSTSRTLVGPTFTKSSSRVVLTDTTQREANARMRRRYLLSDLLL
jgi:hypothetical protein